MLSRIQYQRKIVRDAIKHADACSGKVSVSRAYPRFAVELVLIAVAIVSGCGKKGPDRVHVFPVEGQIILQGKPVADAEITFHPKNPSEKTPHASGKTDAEGKFKVTTYVTGDGAAPGDYNVTVKKLSVIKTQFGYEHGPNLFPAKLASEKTTDWKVTVAQQPTVIPTKTITR